MPRSYGAFDEFFFTGLSENLTRSEEEFLSTQAFLTNSFLTNLMNPGSSMNDANEKIWYEWIQELQKQQVSELRHKVYSANMGYAAPPLPKKQLQKEELGNQQMVYRAAPQVKTPNFQDMNSGAMSKSRSRGLRMAVYGTGSLTMVDIIMMGVFHSIYSFVFGFVCTGLFLYCFHKMNHEFKEAEIIYLEEYHALNATPVDQVAALSDGASQTKALGR